MLSPKQIKKNNEPERKESKSRSKNDNKKKPSPKKPGRRFIKSETEDLFERFCVDMSTPVNFDSQKNNNTMFYIGNITSLTNLISNYCKDITNFKHNLINYSSSLYYIKMKIKGKGYFSSITLPVMQYLLKIQEGLYNTYKIFNNGNLSENDKKKLEVFFRVEKGSTELLFNLQNPLEIIRKPANKMTGNQTFGLIIGFILLYGTATIGSKIHEKNIKKMILDAEIQRQKIQTAALIDINDKFHENKQKELSLLIEHLNNVNSTRDVCSECLKKIAKENEIYINNERLFFDFNDTNAEKEE